MKKSIIAGVILGAMLVPSLVAGAKTTDLDGVLYTRNPIYKAPEGQAFTSGFKTCTAEVKASKDGKTNSQKVSGQGTAETDWVSGPTYASSGTTFTSTHTGYDTWGNYKTKTATKKY